MKQLIWKKMASQWQMFKALPGHVISKPATLIASVDM
jgi:hypothetical protein